MSDVCICGNDWTGRVHEAVTAAYEDAAKIRVDPKDSKSSDCARCGKELCPPHYAWKKAQDAMSAAIRARAQEVKGG